MDALKLQWKDKSFDEQYNETQDLKMLILKLNQDKIMNEKKVLRRETEILRLKQCLQEKDEQLFSNSKSLQNSLKSSVEMNLVKSSGEISFVRSSEDIYFVKSSSDINNVQSHDEIDYVKSQGEISIEQTDHKQKLNQLEGMILKHKVLFLESEDISIQSVLSKIIERALINTVHVTANNFPEPIVTIPNNQYYDKIVDDLRKEVVKLQQQLRLDMKRTFNSKDQYLKQILVLQTQIQTMHHLSQVQQSQLKLLYTKMEEYKKALDDVYLNTLMDESVKEQILKQYLKLKIKYNESQKELKSQKSINTQDNVVIDANTNSSKPVKQVEMVLSRGNNPAAVFKK